MQSMRPSPNTAPSIRLAALALAGFLGAARPASAQVDSAGPVLHEKLTFAGKRLELFPSGDVFATHLADPHRPTNAFGMQFYTVTTIDSASNRRSWLAAGGRFGLFRVNPRTPDGRYWQLSIEAGLDALYDFKNSLDNLGYEGNYGLTFTTAGNGPLAMKFAIMHTSSHVGDEWTRETGRQRIGYTREEFALGLAGRVAGHLRLYGETGLAYHQNTDLQRPLRAQAGIEGEWPRSFAGGLLGFYAAGDFQMWEERDYRVDSVVETGISAYSGSHRWRVGVRYSDGRGPLAEYFQDTERMFVLGLWVDL